MVKKYYIRIEDSEPVSLTNGVYFVIEEDTTNDATEFYLVRKNEYEELLARFNVFEHEVTSEVQSIVDAYLQGGRTLERTNSAYQLISQDGVDSITYNELMSALDVGNGNHTHSANQVVTRTIYSDWDLWDSASQKMYNDKVHELINELESFKDSCQWKIMPISKMNSWDTDRAVLYYNEAIRVCEFRILTSFDSASAYKLYTWKSNIQAPRVPVGYRPSNTRWGTMYVNGSTDLGVCFVGSDGYVGGMFSKGWGSSSKPDAKDVQLNLMWHY